MIDFTRFAFVLLAGSLAVGCGSSANGPGNSAFFAPPAPAGGAAPNQPGANNPAPTGVIIGLDDVSGTGAVTVPVSMLANGNPAPSTIQFDVSYDASRLSVTDVQVTGAATAAGKQVSIADNPGQGSLRVIIFGLNNSAIADGQLAAIQFQATGSGQVPLSLSKLVLADPQAAALSADARPGSVTIP